ncbi:MAG: hypothetical protein ABR562_03680 [Thermoplasmatota archaeon]
MSAGPPTASGHNQNLIANMHLVAAVGDYKVKTATNVRAHRFVKNDTTDKEVQCTTTGNVPLGIVVERVKDSEILTASDYTAADWLKIERGHGTCRKVVLQSGSSAVAPGDELTTGTGGTLKKRASLSAPSLRRHRRHVVLGATRHDDGRRHPPPTPRRVRRRDRRPIQRGHRVRRLPRHEHPPRRPHDHHA